MGDANLRFNACPKCGQEGKYLKSEPEVTTDPEGYNYIVLVLWCTFCGWFRVNDTEGQSIKG